MTDRWTQHKKNCDYCNYSLYPFMEIGEEAEYNFAELVRADHAFLDRIIELEEKIKKLEREVKNDSETY
jgi:hypothetical protein